MIVLWIKKLMRASAAPVVLVLALGMLASAATAIWWRQNIQRNAEAEFQRSVERVGAELERRFRQPVHGLMGIKGMYAGSQQVKRDEFRAYMQARDLGREFPGVRGMGFIEHVMRAELDAFLAAERADGAPQFALWQLVDQNKDDLFVIKLIEPAANNARAQGLDVGSEPVRRQGAQRAVDTGEAAITAMVSLVQDTRKTPGVLMYVPIYAKDSNPTTSEERRAALVGLAYAPIVIVELLDGMAEVASGRIDFELLDAELGQANAPVLFDADNHVEKLAAGQDAAAGRVFSHTQAVALPGRNLTLRINSTPTFEAAIDRASPWWILAVGSLLSALLALLLRQQAQGRQRAEALAGRMTHDLERLAKVVRHTSNAVAISDRDGRINWINEGFTHISGYTLDEALGKTAGELLGNSKADPATLKALAHAQASGVACRVEILNRTKEGRDYWIDTELQPLRDAQGAVTGFMETSNDISSRRKLQSNLETALRDNGALLTTLNLHAIVSVADRAGRITEVNDAFCRISGYSREELVGQNHRIVNSGTHTDSFWATVWADISVGISWRGWVCNRAKDGSLYWVDTFIAPFVGADGNVEKYISLRIDVTESVNANRDLARERQRLDNIIAGTNVGTWEWNVETGDTVFDERWAQLIGYTLEEISPTIETWSRFTHPEDLSRSSALLEQHFNGDIAHYECEVRLLHKDGHWVWVLNRGKLFSRGDDGRPRWMAGTHMDITERKLAEAEAQRSALLLRGAIDAIDEAFVLYDPTDRLVFCNEKYREIYSGVADLIVPGVAFEDLIRAGAERGHYTGAIGRVDEWVEERVAAHLASNTVLLQKLEDGRSLRIVERKMADGHIVGFRIDISELVRSTEAAQQASRAKSQFLANMSHELRTPMNAVLGMLTLLRKTDLSPRQADYAAKSDDAARALMGLLNEILDFSKIEAGKMTLDPKHFRMDHLLRDLSVILSANIGDKPVEVLFDIDPLLPRALVGDAMRLQQVLINLSGNAIKFTAQGEVVVRMEVVAQDDVQVTLTISVRDSGIGISPENQARIFSGFTQAEASTTRRFGGTGLGVAISQRFAELMGGELKLESALGHGSTFYFTITLPLAPSTIAAAGELAQPDTVSFAQPLRALVVDDNSIAREVLARMGHSLGWTVDVADSGESALELLQTQSATGISYQALFIDWQMPGLDGWQTCERIRNLDLAGLAPVIVMVTAHGRELLSMRTDDEQAMLDGFLVKPVTASMLFDAVVDARSGTNHAHPSNSDTAVNHQRLAGMRLLLVEDNLNNQQVARELLQDEGAFVQIANNGQEGLDALVSATQPFDVVLMDLQMPVMDGFTAARSIRQDLQMHTLPIVAMTANAMATDRDECLVAGMNDHAGKPFDLNHLVRVLRKQAGRTESVDAPALMPELALPGLLA
jgi:PAS domain S-box-containing protein